MSKKKYIRIPVELIGSGISSTALIIYSLLADRQELSVKQGYRFRDCSGYYIIYTEQDLADVLSLSVRTVRRMLTELVGAGLIRTRKQGKGLPQKIYVSTDDYITSEQTDVSGQEQTDMAGQEQTEMSGLNIYPESSYPDTIYPRPSTPERPSVMGKQSPSKREEDENELEKYIYENDSNLTTAEVAEIKQRLSHSKKNIHNAKAYIRAVVANYRLERHIPAPQKITGYPAAYDLEAYTAETSGADYINQLMAELDEIRPQK